jgi:O-methyltransferase involved in polyketide biosynthesis
VAATAVAIAAERAAESARTDRLFADPLASVFDDALLRAAGSGIGQVVLLACGLDARAFRLPWPEGTAVFELRYLSPEENDRLLAEHVPGPGTQPAAADGDGHVLDAGDAPWRSTLDAPLAWLSEHGWRARAIDAAALAAGLGRPLPPVLDSRAVGAGCAWRLAAER